MKAVTKNALSSGINIGIGYLIGRGAVAFAVPSWGGSIIWGGAGLYWRGENGGYYSDKLGEFVSDIAFD